MRLSPISRKPLVQVATRLLTVIMGPPGAGKGTISKKIMKDFGYHHVSTGDMLRAHVQEGTEIGKTAKSFMDRGGLVPDGLIIRMITSKLDGLGNNTRVLLDGFPRTRAQAEALDKESEVSVALLLKVPEEEIKNRASDRWIHPGSGRVYTSSSYNRPKVPYRDDATSEPLIQREDDKPEVVHKRLAAYSAMTLPLREYYESRGVLEHFSGDNAPDLVALRRRSDAIYKALHPYLEAQHTRLKV